MNIGATGRTQLNIVISPFCPMNELRRKKREVMYEL